MWGNELSVHILEIAHTHIYNPVAIGYIGTVVGAQASLLQVSFQGRRLCRLASDHCSIDSSMGLVARVGAQAGKG